MTAISFDMSELCSWQNGHAGLDGAPRAGPAPNGVPSARDSLFMGRFPSKVNRDKQILCRRRARVKKTIGPSDFAGL
jgi:hypothetical protein